jgi:hypothetical protein
MTCPIRAWHFTNCTLRNGDPIPPIGEWLEWTGPIAMCRLGLHASRHPFDALQYAPGSILHRVECEDVVEEQDDKLVCRRRKILHSVDCEKLLRRFAKDEALSVIHLWDAPQIVLDYLCSDTEDLREAAWAAAWAAAWEAAWAASCAAAREAAWEAARAATRAATWEATREATRAATWEAARAATWEAARAATWAASRAAARVAAWAASWEEFSQRIVAAFPEEAQP